MTDAARNARADDVLRELASWYLLAADLRHVVAATRSLQYLQRQSTNDPAVLRSLWTSAHISYARCFVDGPVVRLAQTMFDGLPDGRGQAHRFLLHTANKHLAPSASPALQVSVSLDHDASGQPIGIKYTPSPNEASPSDVANLAWLAAEALKHVETVEAALITRLKQRLQASPAGAKGPGAS